MVGLKHGKSWLEGRGEHPPGLVPGQPHTAGLLGIRQVPWVPLCGGLCLVYSWRTHSHSAESRPKLGSPFCWPQWTLDRAQHRPHCGGPRLWGTS